jgi:hypothetical protein
MMAISKAWDAKIEGDRHPSNIDPESPFSPLVVLRQAAVASWIPQNRLSEANFRRSDTANRE